MVEIIENKLPSDFKNWTEFYLYVKEQHSEVLEDYFISYIDSNKNENYTIGVRYFEKQVLQEILSVLPSKKAVICAINELKKNTPFLMSEIEELEKIFEILP